MIAVSSYAQNEEEQEVILKDGWYELDRKQGKVIRKEPFVGKLLSINPKAVIQVSHFESYHEYRPGEIAVYFDTIGTEKWRKMTKNSIGFKIVFILDNEVFYSPLVNSEITTGVCTFTKTTYTKESWYKLEKIIDKLKKR
jgi:preprotein translocase subunit SecD